MEAVQQYELLALLLLVVLLLELAARRLNLPPAAAFTVGGLVMALIPGMPVLTIDPDLVLLVFLPPLLMNAAYFTVWKEFRENIGGIVVLAVGAVAFTTLAVGLVLKSLAPGVPWAGCFALGAIVSPPDAVSAGAVLERLKLPGRLNALLQGESLINDAGGLVLFKFAVVATLTGAFSLREAAGTFCVLAVGGIAFGWVVGMLGLAVMRRLRDSELAITASLLIAVASYAGGDRLGFSGVLATVTTGLFLGWHQHSALSAATRIRMQAFWKVLVFLLESVIFILIGLSLRSVLARLGVLQHAGWDVWTPVAGVVLAVVVARLVWLYASFLVLSVATRLGVGRATTPSLAVATVIGWAGMRGVVTLAAALSLPADIESRDLLLICAFAVILVTVLLQGTTLGPLIRYLGLGRAAFGARDDSADLAWTRMIEA